MDYLHLTSEKNLKSVLKHGILPSRIDLDHHWKSFKYYGLKERKCVYTWGGEHYNNTKYIKDMIYTKMFIHPRNNAYNRVDHVLDWKSFGDEIFGDDGTYYLLKITGVEEKFGKWIHVQESHDDKHGTTVIMDDKYAHDDKPMFIFEDKIQPVNFKIVEKVNVRMYKTNQLGFSFSKTI